MSKVFFTIHKKLLLILILGFVMLFISSNSNGQTSEINFKYVDQQTYSYYINGNWDSLICIGNYALINDIDYYYLRVRMGMAHYNKANYSMAVQHFNRALQFNSKDALSLEYLYYSYLYLNRNLEARLLASKFSDQLNEKLKPELGAEINHIYAEGGVAFSNNFEENSFKKKHLPHDTIPIEQDMNGDKAYIHAGFGGYLENNVSFYIGYGNLTTTKFKQIITPELYKSGYDTILSHGWYYVDTVYSTRTILTVDEYKLTQNEFYGNASIVLDNGISLTPAFHYLNIKSTTIYAIPEPVSFFAQSYDTIPTVYDSFSIVKASNTLNNYVASLSANYYKGLLSYGLNATFSNLNYNNQYQLGASATLFPYGNLDLYATSNLTAAWNNNVNRMIFKQTLGAKILPSFWAEGFVSIGEMLNYNEGNAFTVYNSGDIIKFRAGANIIISLSKQIELNLIYHFLDNQGSIMQNTSDGLQTIKNTSYQNHTIIGGLKWKL
jgi:hypothetical protein